ncbi:MAG: acyltransferase [Rhizomicrobium sp.]
MNRNALVPVRQRLDSLDGWRTISVALVVVDHLVRYSSIGTHDKRFSTFDGYGHLGVEIFFVISGFVICRGFEKELSGSGRISIAAFYIRRCFRIIPPLFVYLVAITLLSLLGIVDYQISALPRALTFTCNIWDGCGGFVANHLWSLSVEEQFYLVFPLLLIVLAQKRKAALGIAVCGFPIMLLALNALKLSGLAHYFSDFLCIAAGVACAEYESEIRNICRILPKWTPDVCFFALLLVVTVLGPDLWSTLARYFLIPPLIALSLMSTVFHNSLTNRLLSSSVFTAIGRSTYTLYLWQEVATAPYGSAGYFFYSFSVAGCVGLSCLSFFFVERRLIGIGARISNSVRNKTVPISSVPTAG